MLGPILLEEHQECSRIEGARLGNLFISRQGLRANTPAISLHQLDPIRIQSVSISWIQLGSNQSPSATVRGVPKASLQSQACIAIRRTQTQSVAPS